MPSLDFKGKSFVYTHHLGVPYRELIVSQERSLAAPGREPDIDGNLIVHGDNLEALKALLPRYAGKVDCVYIDPPYNTGTEGWCYNDAVNSPLMREWLKRASNPVDREDLQRHDKWLCMMWPRLQLLKELLSEEGALFVSIDDNEVHHLRAMLDEIFGEANFITNIVWHKMDSPKNTAIRFSEDHDHIVVYAKHADAWYPNLLERSEEMIARYSNPDNDPRGPWLLSDLAARNEYSAGLYEIRTPSGKVIQGPPAGSYWRVSRQKFDELDRDGRIWWGKGDVRPGIKRFLSEVKDGVVPQTIWSWRDVGSTRNAKQELSSLLAKGHSEELFITPKPVGLVRRILELATRPDSIVLDSFAGSGTTGHAVLDLNKADGGTRRFILCESENYADTLTAERIRRVVKGYDASGSVDTELMDPLKITWTSFKKANEVLDRIHAVENLERGNYDKIEKKIEDGVLVMTGKKFVTERMPGLGGSFAFVELGEPMDLERLLAEAPTSLPSFTSLARYLFFTATGHTLQVPKAPPKSPAQGQAKTKVAKSPASDVPVLIGETPVWRIYLHYHPDEAWLRSPAAALTRTQAEALDAARRAEAPAKQVLVFAAAKYISHRSLRELRVDFAQLPYALHRVQSE